jgi:hypothetical protein
MHRLLAHLRAQGIEQPPGADHQGIAVEALHAVESKAQVTGHIQPQGHLLLAPLQRIGLCQLPKDPPAVDVLKKLCLCPFACHLHIVDIAVLQAALHIGSVLLEDQKIHGPSSAWSRNRFRCPEISASILRISANTF